MARVFGNYVLSACHDDDADDDDASTVKIDRYLYLDAICCHLILLVSFELEILLIYLALKFLHIPISI